MTSFADRARMPGAAQTAGANPAHRSQRHAPRPPWAPIQRMERLRFPSDLEERGPTSATAPNRTGLPDRLKAGLEAQSGLAMDDVRVHRDSPEPARLGALAYTRGADIHLGPGQEQHLPHEAWHVVQQKQGRVRATAQMKDAALNDNPALEAEADRMGADATVRSGAHPPLKHSRSPGGVVQRIVKRGKDKLSESESMSGVLRDYVKDKNEEYILGKNSEADLTKLPVHLFHCKMKYLLGEKHDPKGDAEKTSKWWMQIAQWPGIPTMDEAYKVIPREPDDKGGLLYSETEPLPLESSHPYLLLQLLQSHEYAQKQRNIFPMAFLDSLRLELVIIYNDEIIEDLGEVEKQIVNYSAFAEAYDSKIHGKSIRLTAIREFGLNLFTSWIASLAPMKDSAERLKKFLDKLPASRSEERMAQDAIAANAYVSEMVKGDLGLEALATELAGIVNLGPKEKAAVRAFATSTEGENSPGDVDNAVNAAREQAMIANVDRIDPPLLVSIGNFHVHSVAPKAKQPAQAVDKNDTLDRFTGKWTYSGKK